MALSPAERFIAELGITEPSEIDLEAIAFCAGVTIKVRKLVSCEARIVGRGDQAIVSVDPGMSLRRRRFSVAHELGHWQHHRGKCLHCRSTDISDAPDRVSAYRERVANTYAADLLMPRQVLGTVVGDADRLNVSLIKRVSELFDVSLLASAIRLIESFRFPAILCVHHKTGGGWHKSSKVVPGFWYPSKDLDKDTPAYGILCEDDAESEFPQSIPADAWFDKPSALRFEIKEQSFRIYGGDVATILTLPGDMIEM